MAVKRYDPDAQAYGETLSVPKRYDPESSAYVDTTGKAYDPDAAAWEEKWRKNEILYLYKLGDTCDDVTGGYTPYAYTIQPTNYGFYMPTLTFESDHMRVLEPDGTWHMGTVFTNKAIDVAQYKKLSIDFQSVWNCTQYGGGNFVLSKVCANRYGNDVVATTEYFRSSERGVIEIDISNISDPVYFGIYLDGESGGDFYADVYNVWLEK